MRWRPALAATWEAGTLVPLMAALMEACILSKTHEVPIGGSIRGNWPDAPQVFSLQGDTAPRLLGKITPSQRQLVFLRGLPLPKPF